MLDQFAMWLGYGLMALPVVALLLGALCWGAHAASLFYGLRFNPHKVSIARMRSWADLMIQRHEAEQGGDADAE